MLRHTGTPPDVIARAPNASEQNRTISTGFGGAPNGTRFGSENSDFVASDPQGAVGERVGDFQDTRFKYTRQFWILTEPKKPLFPQRCAFYSPGVYARCERP